MYLKTCLVIISAVVYTHLLMKCSVGLQFITGKQKIHYGISDTCTSYVLMQHLMDEPYEIIQDLCYHWMLRCMNSEQVSSLRCRMKWNNNSYRVSILITCYMIAV